MLTSADFDAEFGAGKAEATVPSLVEALKQNIGKPLQLEVQRGKISRCVSIIALEARSQLPDGE